MGNASTAVLVKSRAKYSLHLTNDDYDALINCGSIKDIVAYLRTNTHYNVSLEGIQEAAVHRGNLETLLKNKVYEDFAQLCKFEKSIGQHYFEYMMVRNEVERLLIFIRYLIAGTPEKFIFSLPDFFYRHSHIDFVQMTVCKNFDELLQVLSNTDYYKLLLPFRPEKRNNNVDFTAIESVLERYRFYCASEITDKYFSGSEAEELMTIFSMQAELDNLRKIYRAKKYYEFPIDVLKAMLNKQRCFLNKISFEDVVNANDNEEMLKILKKTRYRSYLAENDVEDCFDRIADKMLYSYCRRKMRFSQNATTVMASVIQLFEIEIDNLTNIIEGKRYGIDNDSIKSMLITG